MLCYAFFCETEITISRKNVAEIAGCLQLADEQNVYYAVIRSLYRLGVVNLQRKKCILLHAALMVVGGTLYMLIELLWRRRTHWSMLLVGGACFDVIGGIHRRLKTRRLSVRCAVCAAAVTGVELVSGYVLNVALGLGVWDYSRQPLNVGGQVCLLYAGFWMALSAVAGPVYEVCRLYVERLIPFRDSTLSADKLRT